MQEIDLECSEESETMLDYTIPLVIPVIRCSCFHRPLIPYQRYKGFEYTIELGFYVHNKHSNHNKACLGLLIIDSRCSFVCTTTHQDVVPSGETYTSKAWLVDKMATLCDGCLLPLVDLAAILVDAEKLWEFLANHGLVLSALKCPTCDSDLQVNSSFRFRCSRRTQRRTTKKIVKRRCSTNVSARKDTFLANSVLEPKTIIHIVYWFCLGRLTYKDVAAQVHVAHQTIVDWYSFCREVTVNFCVEHSTKLGGPGSTVEIDEAKFGKRKYQRGRLIEGHWVFGGFERGSKKLFLVPVPDRTKETLVACIHDWILPGTHIVSDCWASYSSLSVEGYTHSTVNHSLNFVDPESGASTQNIERVWRDVRRDIPTFGRRQAHFVGYLSFALFKKVYPEAQQRFCSFLKAAAQLYPPAQ